MLPLKRLSVCRGRSLWRLTSRSSGYQQHFTGVEIKPENWMQVFIARVAIFGRRNDLSKSVFAGFFCDLLPTETSGLTYLRKIWKTSGERMVRFEMLIHTQDACTLHSAVGPD